MANISALLEDTKILQAALNGDEDIHKQLYKEIEAFIHHQKHIWVAKLFSGNPGMNDEVLSEINLAYLLALRKYNPQKASFIAFFATCLNNHMLMYYRKHLKKLKGINIDSLDREVDQMDGGNIVLGDCIPVEEDKLKNVFFDELYHEVENLDLPNPKYENLILLKLQGFTQVKMVERLGLTQSYVSRVLRKQINHLAKVLNDKDIYIDRTFPMEDEHIQKIDEKQTLEMIRLKEDFNLSYAQIGGIFGLHKDAVCSRIRRYKGELK